MEIFIVLLPVEFTNTPSVVEKIHNETFLSIDALNKTLKEVLELDDSETDEAFEYIHIFTIDKFISNLNNEEINIHNYFVTSVNIIFDEEPTKKTTQ